MKFFLFTFITDIDQMILLEEQLWGSASAIQTNIRLTKDLINNKKGASITASIWKIVLKNLL